MKTLQWHSKYLGILTAGILCIATLASQAAVVTNLYISFETGYSLGPLNGQQGGIMGGPWTVFSPDIQTVETNISNFALGTHAVSEKRNPSTAGSLAPLATALDFTAAVSSNIYFSFDVYRPDDTSSAYWSLYRQASGANPGLGLYIPTGANPTVQVITNGPSVANRINTGFVVTNGDWYRFEFEANNVTRKYDVFAQTLLPNGATTPRATVISGVSWDIWNSFVDNFYSVPQNNSGGSPIYIDNITLLTGLSFPVFNPIPEPSTSLVFSIGIGLLAFRHRKP